MLRRPNEPPAAAAPTSRERLFGRPAPSVELSPERVHRHLLDALGRPREVASKLHRLGRAGLRLARYRDIGRRLEALQAEGRIANVPGRLQLLFGGLDMLRFLFEPGSMEVDRQRNVSPALHRVLRVLGDPVSVLDPGGLTSDRQGVVDHLIDNFHFNPGYDLELLATFPGGLAALEHACRDVVEGTHPRAGAIHRRFPDPSYHERLAAYAAAARRDPRTPPPRFQGPRGDGPELDPEARRSFEAAAGALSDLCGFLDYCGRLPSDAPTLVRRLREVRYFPDEHAA